MRSKNERLLEATDGQESTSRGYPCGVGVMESVEHSPRRSIRGIRPILAVLGLGIGGRRTAGPRWQGDKRAMRSEQDGRNCIGVECRRDSLRGDGR